MIASSIESLVIVPVVWFWVNLFAFISLEQLFMVTYPHGASHDLTNSWQQDVDLNLRWWKALVESVS